MLEHVQNSLILQLQESINDRGLLKALVLGGIPGSGKTHVATQLKDGAIEPRIVNTDKYYEYFIRLGFDQGSRYFIDRAKILTQHQLFHYLNGMLPLIVDSTSSDPERTTNRIKLLKHLGYDVAGVWITTDIEKAIERAANRDRKVSIEIIRRANFMQEKSKQILRKQVSPFIEINNTADTLDTLTIAKAYKAVRGFFHSHPSTVGKDVTKKMKEYNVDKLVPAIHSEEKLRSIAESWY